MTTPWWAGLAPVELAVECGDQTHHLIWRDGVLTPADHADADRERVLAALGGDPLACLELVDLWNRHTDDLDALVRASRGLDDLLPDDGDTDDGDPDDTSGHSGIAYRGSYVPLSRTRRPGPGQRFGWYAYGAPGDDGPSSGGLDRLLTLRGGLPDRLVATVIATWIERNDSGDPRAVAAVPALKAALYGRFTAVVRTWLAVPAAIELTVVEAGHPPSLHRHDGGLRAELPLSWLSDVWCRDLATTAGRLTLAAQQLTDGSWHLVTIGPDFGPHRAVTLRL